MGESCLVLRRGEPAGFVTSIAVSPGLGKMIGMAHAHPDDNRPGAWITLRDRAGAEVQATVVGPALHDPDNKRQEM